MRVKAVVAIVTQHKDVPSWHKLHKFKIFLAYSLKKDLFEREREREIMMLNCDTVPVTNTLSDYDTLLLITLSFCLCRFVTVGFVAYNTVCCSIENVQTNLLFRGMYCLPSFRHRKNYSTYVNNYSKCAVVIPLGPSCSSVAPAQILRFVQHH